MCNREVAHLERIHIVVYIVSKFCTLCFGKMLKVYIKDFLCQYVMNTMVIYLFFHAKTKSFLLVTKNAFNFLKKVYTIRGFLKIYFKLKF